MPSTYPTTPDERDRWTASQRPPRNVLDPYRPYAFFVEDECSADGTIEPIATVFLTNKECPWRCVMCDLWRNTLTETVPVGAIPEQIDYALSQLPPAAAIKLYNSGSFFDPRAIPPKDYPAIAGLVNRFHRVIVESHPALVNPRSLDFRNLLTGRLEVAMGLETAHPWILEKLNKRMTLPYFASTAHLLRSNKIDLRVFILVQPPFMRPEESLHWAERSLDFAFDCGATAATLIPTRGGNGAVETLAEDGEFAPPHLETVEAAFHYGLSLSHSRVFPARVFVDLWDLRQHSGCSACYELRLARLHAMNLRQVILNPVTCEQCGGHS